MRELNPWPLAASATQNHMSTTNRAGRFGPNITFLYLSLFWLYGDMFLNEFYDECMDPRPATHELYVCLNGLSPCGWVSHSTQPGQNWQLCSPIRVELFSYLTRYKNTLFFFIIEGIVPICRSIPVYWDSWYMVLVCVFIHVYFILPVITLGKDS
jgi:hypothetical protein